jgi:hypothetical protein
MCNRNDAVDSAKKQPNTAPECSTTPCPNPNEDSKTSGNRVDLIFDPDKSGKVTKCEKIVHVQFIRIYVDGKVVKPGDFVPAFKYRDKVMTEEGWWIDHVAREKTPDYQQGTGDGKKNGGSKKATITDTPSIGDDTSQGAYDPVTNPTGWKKVRYEFQTFAYCMKGPDCGKWYEGTSWEYTKTWEEHRDGKTGTSKITDSNVTSGPSSDQIKAFDKFNKEKGFVPCR